MIKLNIYLYTLPWIYISTVCCNNHNHACNHGNTNFSMIYHLIASYKQLKNLFELAAVYVCCGYYKLFRFTAHFSINWEEILGSWMLLGMSFLAAGSRLSRCIMEFFSRLQLSNIATILNLTSLAGCMTWCPTDLQNLCCKALIKK